MAENAPIPWELHEIDAEDGEDWPHHLSIDDADGEEVATIVHRPGPPVPDVKYEQGWRIVRSVNSHADLLAALRAILTWDDMWTRGKVGIMAIKPLLAEAEAVVAAIEKAS